MNAIAEISEERQAKLASRLMALSPEVVEVNLLAKMRDLLGSTVVIESRRLFPANGPSYSVPVAIKLPATASSSTAREALSAVEAAFVPAPASVIVEEIARLRAVTAKRPADDATAEMIAVGYAEGLRQYPADIAIAVLRKRRVWWPALAELQNEADMLVLPRKMLRTALEAAAAGKVTGSVRECLRPPGARKAPDNWRERAGMAAAAEPLKLTKEQGDAKLDAWKPEFSQVKVSSSLASFIEQEKAPTT